MAFVLHGDLIEIPLHGILQGQIGAHGVAHQAEAVERGGIALEGEHRTLQPLDVAVVRLAHFAHGLVRQIDLADDLYRSAVRSTVDRDGMEADEAVDVISHHHGFQLRQLRGKDLAQQLGLGVGVIDHVGRDAHLGAIGLSHLEKCVGKGNGQHSVRSGNGFGRVGRVLRGRAHQIHQGGQGLKVCHVLSSFGQGAGARRQREAQRRNQRDHLPYGAIDHVVILLHVMQIGFVRRFGTFI